jgi:hypothetical protein
LSFGIFEPSFDTIFNTDFVDESDSFIFWRNQIKNLKIETFIGSFSRYWNVVDVEFLDSLETFFDVFVDFGGIFAVSEQFEKIIIGEEVESWECASFGL